MDVTPVNSPNPAAFKPPVTDVTLERQRSEICALWQRLDASAAAQLYGQATAYLSLTTPIISDNLGDHMPCAHFLESYLKALFCCQDPLHEEAFAQRSALMDTMRASGGKALSLASIWGALAFALQQLASNQEKSDHALWQETLLYRTLFADLERLLGIHLNLYELEDQLPLLDAQPFITALFQAITHAIRHQESLTVVSILPHHGHELSATDTREPPDAKATLPLARLLVRSCRAGDTVGRMDDGVLTLILGKTSGQEAVAWLQRIIDRFKKEKTGGFQFSSGMAHLAPGNKATPEELLRISRNNLEHALSHIHFGQGFYNHKTNFIG
ncbi:diguanylate cyclase [Magnetococcus marinus MC-1]|uniref:Diguanylate cyclase n=1 Tax=Magnetococcus marinus (strain ATCC BAA-1437 / JCM 17883 / MC-1) TaxID=156889 RepID=A0LA46_MAGMM|nr:diguanylate cyclase [Magnetococcus marinus]ABK44839.1 diguanylate cyclase [Magnetococcus marinus MC-1]